MQGARPGSTSIKIACEIKNWDIIALLLEHGATAPSTTPSFSEAECRRLNLLVKKFTNKPRPARPCPCWSGQLLSLCHAAEDKPFPPEFICNCGTGKTYGRCCARRIGMFMHERWDPSGDRIIPIISSTISTSGPAADCLRASKLIAQSEAMGIIIPEDPEDMSVEYRHELADTLESQKHIDVAFAYALRQVDFCPRPAGQSISKRESLDTQYAWNKAIDQYIALKTDPRSREEIEKAAKIGSECGALYRTCDGPDCQTTEGPNLPKLKKCSKCQIGVYCGQECQKRSWRLNHKAEC
ncbi:hypothetical protein FIBSPDRAFT_772668, partial [Athelia psychrophila]